MSDSRSTPKKDVTPRVPHAEGGDSTTQGGGGTLSPEASDRLDMLAESFVERLRIGDHPSISEYVERHPELEEEIRDLFPTLAMLERCAPEERASQQPAATEPMMGLPQQLGPYRILREVGRGGMGVVFEAEHETMRRRVALKVLPLGFTTRGTHLERFLAEARAAGRLHHTNIVPVFEVGSHDGIHYYAMQFIQGQSLDLVFDELRHLRCNAEPTLDDVRGGAAGRPAPPEKAPPDETPPDEKPFEQGPRDKRQSDDAPRRAAARQVATGLLTGHFQQSLPLIEEDTASQDRRSPTAEATALADTPPAGSIELLSAPPRRADRPRMSSSGSSSDLLRQTSGSDEAVRDDYYQRVAGIGLQVAHALAYAHQHGIIHRDIKPSNLILDTAGVVWVTDFGLAKNQGDDLTRSGDIVGTLRYMAPERLRGQGDARSDVYSLGLTLYELCTLQPAMREHDRAGLLHEITFSEPLPPRKVDPRVPRDLETIVLKAIDKDPARRYPSARALADDLQLFIADRPIQARRISATERAWRWCRRNPRQAGLLASVLVLLAILVVGSLWFGYVSQRQALKLAIQTHRSNVSLYRYSLGQAETRRWSGRPGQRLLGLEAIRQAMQLMHKLKHSPQEQQLEIDRLRNHALACLPLVDLRELRHIPREIDPLELGFTFDAPYERYARGDARGNISIHDAQTQRKSAHLPGPGYPAGQLRFSPDGAYLAAKYHRDDGPTRVRIWKLESLQPILDFQGQHVPVPVAFDAESRRVAVGLRSREVVVHRLADGQVDAHCSLPRPATALAFDPVSGQLAIADRTRDLRIWDPDGEAPRAIRAAGEVMSLDWAPGGTRLLAGATNGHIYDYPDPAQFSDQFRVLSGHRSPVTSLFCHPGGTRAVSSAWDGSTYIWDLVSGDPLLWVYMSSLVNTGFSRDGQRLALQSSIEGWKVWQLDDNGTLRIGQNSPRMGIIWSADFHPRHPRLVACGRDGGLEFLDAESGRVLAAISTPRMRTVRFSRDGTALITSGTQGVQRWPLVVDDRQVLRVDPPKSLREGFAERICLLPDESRLAIDRGRVHAEVVRPEADSADAVRIAHPNLDHVVLSPDGRWLVTSTWQGKGLRVWNAADGKQYRDLLPNAGSVTPAFSPDGRWLAASEGSHYHLWEVDKWKPAHRIAREMPDGWPGPLVFSPDSRLLVVAHSRYVVSLLDPVTGRSLARLESPRPGILRGARFSRDGARLALATDENVQVWNLRAVRRQLAALELDWNAPPLPPPGPDEDWLPKEVVAGK